MNICVYGASSKTIDKSYLEAGEKLGRLMAERGHTLVFGGGQGGLMGAVARGMTEGNGYIIGISPKYFDVDGIIYEGCDEVHVTETMRERKQIMEDLSEAFVATPGGAGTFDELFEILTLKQVGRHNKPIVFLNTNNYYKPVFDLIDEAIAGNFMTAENRKLYAVFEQPAELLDFIEAHTNDEIKDISAYKDIKG